MGNRENEKKNSNERENNRTNPTKPDTKMKGRRVRLLADRQNLHTHHTLKISQSLKPNPQSKTPPVTQTNRLRDCILSSMAAQTMVISSGVCAGHALNREIAQRLRPNAQFARLFFTPLPSSSVSVPARGFQTVAVFKSKTKVPAKKVVKPKEKVEDGIFGTSGGIGFTKQNELFVGRVAMIGFAASLLGEGITGKGILAQLNLETGVPIYEAEPLLLFFILFTLLGAIGALGDRGRFIDDPEPATGLDRAVIPPGKGLRSALGLKEGGPLFGFTKANELFVGRLAQVGFAFSLIGEIITGKGALAQLNIETGVPINEIEPLVLLNVVFFFIAALNPGTGKFVTDEEEDD